MIPRNAVQSAGIIQPERMFREPFAGRGSLIAVLGANRQVVAYDVVGKRRQTAQGGALTATSALYGAGITFPGSGGNYIEFPRVDTTPHSTFGGITWIVVFRLNALPTWSGLIGRSSGSGGATLSLNGGTLCWVRPGLSSNGLLSGFTTNVTYCAAFSYWEPAVNQYAARNLDTGQLLGSGSASLTATGGNIHASLWIGNWGTAGGADVNGTIVLAAESYGFLGVGQLEQITRDPFVLIRESYGRTFPMLPHVQFPRLITRGLLTMLVRR